MRRFLQGERLSLDWLTLVWNSPKRQYIFFWKKCHRTGTCTPFWALDHSVPSTITQSKPTTLCDLLFERHLRYDDLEYERRKTEKHRFSRIVLNYVKSQSRKNSQHFGNSEQTLKSKHLRKRNLWCIFICTAYLFHSLHLFTGDRPMTRQSENNGQWTSSGNTLPTDVNESSLGKSDHNHHLETWQGCMYYQTGNRVYLFSVISIYSYPWYHAIRQLHVTQNFSQCTAFGA